MAGGGGGSIELSAISYQLLAVGEDGYPSFSRHADKASERRLLIADS
jgi:hypothetical protein